MLLTFYGMHLYKRLSFNTLILGRHIQIETDASGYAIARVLN